MNKWMNLLRRMNNPNIILGFFVFTAFVLRLLPWNSIIIDWGKTVIFIQPDAYYQMRRAMIWAMNFPRLITMDYYMAYPFGAECPWPPLYNFTIAILTLIFSGGKPNVQVLQLITALLPPIIAALCIIPVYKIVKIAWRNERLAIFAAFFAIIMPGMLGYSTIGSGDHHVAETFLFLWFFYYALKMLQKILDGKDRFKDVFITGVMIALGILIWQGQVVFYTVWVLYLILIVFIHRRERDFTNKVSLNFMYSAFIGAAIGALVRFIIPRSTEQTLFDFGFFSYFQPMYVSFIFLSVFFINLFLQKVEADRRNILRGLVVIAFVVVVILFVKPLRIGVLNGIKFLLKTDPWHSSINEFQTTFSFKMMLKTFNSKQGLIEIIYFLSFLFPVGFGILYLVKAVSRKERALYFLFYQIKGIKRIERPRFITSNIFLTPKKACLMERRARIRILFYGVAGVLIGALAFYQKRWGNAFSPILAIGIALFVNSAYLKIRAGHRFIREFFQWRREKKKIKVGLLTRFIVYWEKSPFVLSFFCVLFVMVPYFFIAESMLNTAGYPIQSDLYNSLVWIKNYTPKTSYLWTPDKRPEYGILAPWDHGHYIQYISERPTIVNNFGHQLRGDGFKIASYVWSCETEEELMDIFNKYNIRFAFLNDPINYFNKNFSVYLKPGFLEKYIVFQDGHFGEKIPTYNELFFTLPLPRLWVFDGSSTTYGPALMHFRLVFESQNPSYLQYFDDVELKFYKMFEYVKGAQIEGKTTPRSIVFFKAHFITNFDRPFEWKAAAIADDNGHFKAVLPYATGEDNIFVKPLSPYFVYSDGKFFELIVNNSDVLEGKKITLDFAKGKKPPKEFEEEVKSVLKNLAGQVKSPNYINIHKKPFDEKR